LSGRKKEDEEGGEKEEKRALAFDSAGARELH
jgi:hypothetical protein